MADYDIPIKGIRREKKRQKSRYGMVVTGKSVFTIEHIQANKARMQRGNTSLRKRTKSASS